MPLGVQQNNDFTQFTMDVWNDKIFYQEKEFPAGFMAASVLNIPEEKLPELIQAGDKNAAERLVSQNEGYLTELVRAYTPRCELEDLKQEAALALLDAAGRFDPAYGTKLLTYATPAIEAALSDYAAQYSSSLSIPISRYNQLRRVAYL